MPRWLLAVLFITGCSFGLRGPKDDRPRNRAPECSTKKGLVVLDAVAGSVFATTAAITLATDEPAWALVPAAVAAVYFGAALSGNGKVNACRGAEEQFLAAAEKAPVDLTGQSAPEQVPDETIAKAAPAAPAPAGKAAPAAPRSAGPPGHPLAPQQTDKDDEWIHFWREVTP